MATKQVIVIRKDLKMRRGKECSQVAHASLAFLGKRILNNEPITVNTLTQAELDWFKNSFAKVVLQAPNEQTLLDIEVACKKADIQVELIVDSGRTEFHGQPTRTALAIGPDFCEKIDTITGRNGLYPLELY